MSTSHSAGFEPARGDPKRFLVSRLNRSATNASTYCSIKNMKKERVQGAASLRISLQDPGLPFEYLK